MVPFIPCRTTFASALLTLVLACTPGCLVTRVKWVEPDYIESPVGLFGSRSGLSHAEQLYATALEREQQGLESCVDLFFDVAVATCPDRHPVCCDKHQCPLHESALKKLVVSGQHHGRLDPRSGLVVCHRGQRVVIPVHHHGFVWQPSDFQKLVPVGRYKTNGLRTLHRRAGVGVPMVVSSIRPDDESFVVQRPTFAATLRMTFSETEIPDSSDDTLACQLELYDPLRMDQVTVNGSRWNLAKDLSAPLAYRLRNDPQTILDDFINPGSPTGETELRTIEPYQPGKVPIVFIHGLLSNPYTWAEMINELHAHPGFVDHFQIWVVEYPTGRPFLVSAAECREKLRAARISFDPTLADAQLSNIVLVGHSVGGLVSKLQVTSSGDQLWRSVANRPFDQVFIPAGFEQNLADAFFFEPSPDVSRVVFIGTPHAGSRTANRMIGRLGSSLVRQPETLRQAHDALIRRNPGVFSREIRRRIPTSIDLLEPNSKLLGAIGRLPAKSDVVFHTVAGNRCLTLGHGRSDGVVSLRSARDDRASTERLVGSRHTGLTRHPDTIQELLCILRDHLQPSCPSDEGSESAWTERDTSPMNLTPIEPILIEPILIDHSFPDRASDGDSGPGLGNR